MYNEHQPHPLLSRYIETYWTANASFVQAEKVKILPDGCIDILINLDGRLTEGNLVPFTPYIIGAMTTFSEIEYRDTINMLGIRFCPGGISAFIRTPVNEFTDLRVDLSLADSLFDEAFYKIPFGEITTSQLVAHIDRYFIAKLKDAYPLCRQILHAVDIATRAGGLVTVDELAKQACLSQRQFGRKFKAIVGLSPKEFCRVMRFKHAQQYVKSNPGLSLFISAVDCGYYDHAHFLKEFKRFTGGSPLSF